LLVEQSIARVQTGEGDKPVTPVILNKVTIVPEGQPLPPSPAAQKPVAPSQ
jgi:peptidyl-prolyl cis-trans isomerase A (cyclophilin A)